MNINKTMAIKVKETELSQLTKYGFKEHVSNDNHFYFIDGKEKFEGHFSFKKQLVKNLTKKGVEFVVDANDGLIIVKSFNELLGYLESEALEEKENAK